jgi:hypothetical protein
MACFQDEGNKLVRMEVLKISCIASKIAFGDFLSIGKLISSVPSLGDAGSNSMAFFTSTALTSLMENSVSRCFSLGRSEAEAELAGASCLHSLATESIKLALTRLADCFDTRALCDGQGIIEDLILP